MMIEIKKLSSIHTKKKIKKDKKRTIKLKFKDVSVNMKLNNKEGDNNNGKEVSNSRKSCYSK